MKRQNFWSVIKRSTFFDEAYYLEQNPDVVAYGIDPAKHYLLFGGFEGRNPSEKFDSLLYLEKYPDVKNSGMNPLVHYVLYGKNEGRHAMVSNIRKRQDNAGYTNPLEKYFYENSQKIIHKWPHYFQIYHRHFQRYVGKPCVILEIGVYSGGSLQMWKNYFGKKAKIIGIDIDPKCIDHAEENISIFIGSQSDRIFLRQLKNNIPKIDILIDDGGHTMEQQVISFEELFDHINDDGIYCCEDTHTSYWKEYGGGYKKQETFIEHSKSLIDKLNGHYIHDNNYIPSALTLKMDSIHFYDSMVLIEKSARKIPWHDKRGHQPTPEEEIRANPGLAIFNLKLKLLGIEKPDNLSLEYLAGNEPLMKNLFPEKFDGNIWPETGETMIGYLRLTNLEQCVLDTIQNNVEGDLIETGVWRGGACIFMRALLEIKGITNKKVWVADSFEGLPKPDPARYPEDAGNKLHEKKMLAVSQQEVEVNFKKYNLLDDQVIFVKGWFKNTMPEVKISKLSILRLDGDMYDSTIDVLFYLYPKLSVGGYCIIDDWGALAPCKKAVEDYRKAFNICEKIHIIDWTGVYWKKEKEIIDISREDFISNIKINQHGHFS